MINLVQLQPEYRFDTKDIDPYCDMDLEECGWHVRKDIKTIIEKWNVQPNPERDAKGKVPRNRTNALLVFLQMYLSVMVFSLKIFQLYGLK